MFSIYKKIILCLGIVVLFASTPAWAGKADAIITAGGKDACCEADASWSLLVHVLDDQGNARGVLRDPFGPNGEDGRRMIKADIDCALLSEDGSIAIVRGAMRQDSPQDWFRPHLVAMVVDDHPDYGDMTSFSIGSTQSWAETCQGVLDRFGGGTVEGFFDFLLSIGYLFPDENGQVKIMQK